MNTKENFLNVPWLLIEARGVFDVEELSARLSLMAAAGSEKELLREAASLAASPASSLAATPDGNYLDARCVYLEQLLSGKVKLG
ncbi:unnamed protein product [Phaedon cochleariae]|uniref:Uncharacterized protein n=1 Tax=Phaedon cochleariae TaxID=80249 RepID=A0A9N9SHR8_PHACE|nr:unnamed protein product [Phaedon cochleariae]